MAEYRLEFRSSVCKDLKRIHPSFQSSLLKKIHSLASDPFPPKVCKLQGSESLYRVRVGDYRIIYEVNQTHKLVLVHYVRHRKDAYKKNRNRLGNA